MKNTTMKNTRFPACWWALLLLLLLGLLVTGSALASNKYRVSAQVFHFGELIAQPVIDVEEGKTTGGEYSVPGESQYTFVVLLRPGGDDRVFASIQFSSGKLNIQPNLLVDIGQETSATIDKVNLNLLIQRIVEVPEGNRITFHD